MRKPKEEVKPSRYSAYIPLIRPALIAWFWIMPVMTLFRQGIASFYISSALSIIASLLVWHHEKVRTWAYDYFYRYFDPKSAKKRMYDLAIDIFITMLILTLVIGMGLGAALLAKLAFL